MIGTSGELLTTGDIARRLGVTTSQVEYALGKGHIECVGRVGLFRVFTPDQVGEIRAALARVSPLLAKRIPLLPIGAQATGTV